MKHEIDLDHATLVCRRCGRAVAPYPGYGGHFRHARPRCGAPMRYGETCARYAGHAWDQHGAGHRTRYAMDCQIESRRRAA